MAVVTKAALRTRIRSRADMVDQTAFLTDSEIDEFMTASASELHDFLIETFSGDYVHSSQALTIVAGTEAYDLSSTFYKLLGVDCVVNGKTVSLRPFTWHDRAMLRNSSLVASGQMPRYRIENKQIRFLPAPASALAITVHYAPEFAYVTAGAPNNGVDFPNGFEEYIVIDCAIKALRKEESDTSALEQDKNRQIARIQASAPERDFGAPPSAVDVETDDIDPRFFF